MDSINKKTYPSIYINKLFNENQPHEFIKDFQSSQTLDFGYE